MSILYTIDCPSCKVLEKKLNAKNIPFETCKDEKVFAEKGYTAFPVLYVDGAGTMSFSDAIKWVNNQEG